MDQSLWSIILKYYVWNHAQYSRKRLVFCRKVFNPNGINNLEISKEYQFVGFGQTLLWSQESERR